MPSPTFTDEHVQLLRLSKRILAAVNLGSPEAIEKLSVHRIALSKLVNQHCSQEIALVNARARELRGDPKKTAVIRRFHDELLAWRGDLMACNASWPQRKVASDPRGFSTVFSGLNDRLQARVRWEESVFYPAIFGTTARH